MIKIIISKKLTKEIKKIDKRNPRLSNEILNKILEFQNPKNHKQLGVHKLHGKLKKEFAFYVSYKHRIIFEYLNNKKTAHLLTFGDHSIYE
jgi:mRNA-degrading endonuclease YafQ of YafQ-DinJ toxin-antitoxin module